MIDIHTHIIPNVDDGSSSMEESIKLLKLEIENGIDHVVLTPHINEINKDIDKIKKLFNELLSNVNLPIKLTLGSEIYYYPNMLRDLEDNKLLTIGDSKYVLIEFSTTIETNISDIVYDLKIKGYKPIVAHIERYNYLTNDDYYSIKKNALIQVNTISFDRKEYKKSLKFLMKNKLVDFIASDCHNLTNRSINFGLAKKKIKKYKCEYIIENVLEI